MTFKISLGKANIILKQGDITKEEADAIVNAANSSLLGGGGVDGAIHRAGGPAILKECKEIRAKVLPEGCPTGHAVITGAGNLKAKYVIHAVGPDMRTGIGNGPELLKKAYQSCLNLAVDKGIKTIAFPSISTGIYSYPIQEAAAVVFQTLDDFFKTSKSSLEVRFVLYSKEDFESYKKVFESMNKPRIQL